MIFKSVLLQGVHSFFVCTFNVLSVYFYASGVYFYAFGVYFYSFGVYFFCFGVHSVCTLFHPCFYCLTFAMSKEIFNIKKVIKNENQFFENRRWRQGTAERENGEAYYSPVFAARPLG